MMSKKIMILSDGDISDDGLARMLESWGYSTHHYSLKSSLIPHNLTKPDLIIVDINTDNHGKAQEMLKHFDAPTIYLQELLNKADNDTNNPSLFLNKPVEDDKLKFAAEMAFYHVKTDKKLKENHETYRLLYENAPIAYQSLDEDGYILTVNNTWLEKLGYLRENVLGNWFGDFLAPECVDKFRTNFPIFKADGEVFEVEFNMIKANNSAITVSFDGKIGYDEKGNFKQTHCIFKDITNQKRTEKALMESEKYYKTIFENTGTATIIVEEDHTVSLVNTEFEKLYGMKRELIEGKKKFTDFISGEYLEMMLEYYNNRRIGTGNVPRNYEFDFIDSNGSVKNIFITVAVIPGTGKSLVSLQDITESKDVEKELQTNIHEKDILLREIHHRVKNNLQIISSLLNLQSRYIDDDDALDVFTESQNRVRSMAIIHEKLYKSKKMSKIDFSEYIIDLTDSLFYNYGVGPSKINLIKKMDKIFFDVDTSIPCGLIVNELITNCVKHAFPDDNNGEITIELADNDGSFLLKVVDDGVGFPENLDFRNTESLGLQLVTNLVNQLDGTIQLENNGGTSFLIEFKELNYRNRK